MGIGGSRYPFRSLDRVMAVAGCIADMVIGLELEFSGSLDPGRLAKAVELTVDAEPVLGCRFVRHWRSPCWERSEGAGREAFLFTTDHAGYDVFKHAPMDLRAGPQLKACLLHSSNADRLLLKVTHEASDTFGLKEAAARVSDTYGRLAAEPGFRPAANPGTSRSLWQVMRRVPRHAYPRVYLDFLGETWRGYIYVPKAVQTLPLDGGRGGRPVFVCRSLSEDRVARLVEYGHAVGATVNDMVLAGFFRALASQGDWDRKRQLRVMTSVDLRRYLPGGRGDAVANLSSPEGITLGTGLGDGFPATLKMVAAHTQRRKSGWIGLGDCVGTVPAVRYLPFGLVMAALPKVVRATIRWHRFPPILTNMGVVDPEAVTFDRAPLRASFLPPPYHPPAFFAAVGSYAGTLTLSAGIPSFEEGTVGRFFDRVLSELPA